MTVIQQVQPGLCLLNPDTGLPECPPPTEIDVIRVKRIFSDGFETQEEDIEIPFEAPTLEVITAEAQEAQCVSAEVNLIDCFIVDENHVRVVYSLQVTARVPLDEGGYEFSTATEIVTNVLCLQCATNAALDLECEFYPRCLYSFISERDDLGNVTQVTSYTSICMVVRTFAQVQLYVPSYGFGQPSACDMISPTCPVSPQDE